MLRMVSQMNEVPPSPEIVIVDTKPEHVRELRETIREADRREIESYGFTCAKGLWRSYKNSLVNKTALIEGEVAAVWGCGGTFIGETGQPWLLTSHAIKKISPLKFARAYKREVNEMINMFPKLENYCAAEYHEALRLLDIAGFTIGEPEQMGKGMFRKFTLERAV